MVQQIAVSVVSLLALLGCSAPADQPGGAFNHRAENISILDIIDGDTIRIAGSIPGETISAGLTGYDTPEASEPGCPEELALGNLATARLQTIIRDAVRIDTRRQGVDRYQRVLLSLTVDGRELSDIMVSEGLAVRYAGGQRVNWCQRLAAT
jgi:micrococcal nuclease